MSIVEKGAQSGGRLVTLVEIQSTPDSGVAQVVGTPVQYMPNTDPCKWPCTVNGGVRPLPHGWGVETTM